MSRDFPGGLAAGGTAIPVIIRVYTQGIKEAQTGFDTLRGSMNLLRGIITQASITTFVFSMLMRRQSQTARRLATVQENTAETLRKYGRHSLEAKQALRQLEQAQENAKFAQIEFALQTVLTIGSIGTLIFRIGDLVTKLGLLESAYISVAIAKLVAFGGGALGAIGLLGGAAIGGIAIGSIIFGGGDASDSTFDRQWKEVGVAVQRERRRQRR